MCDGYVYLCLSPQPLYMLGFISDFWYFSAKEELEEAKVKVSDSVVQLEGKLSEVNQQMDVENKRWQRVLDLEAKSWKELILFGYGRMLLNLIHWSSYWKI